MLCARHCSECFKHIQSVQSLSHVRLFATPWITARQASLSITISRSSPRLTSIESVMPSSHLILYHPLLLLPPIPPSIRVLPLLNSPNNPKKCVPFSFCLKNIFQNVSMDLSFVVCSSFLNFTLFKKKFFFLLVRSMEVLKTHESIWDVSESRSGK